MATDFHSTTLQVLINLLIAMMSSTYSRIDQDATAQWQLVRARLILNVDRRKAMEVCVLCSVECGVCCV